MIPEINEYVNTSVKINKEAALVDIMTRVMDSAKDRTELARLKPRIASMLDDLRVEISAGKLSVFIPQKHRKTWAQLKYGSTWHKEIHDINNIIEFHSIR